MDEFFVIQNNVLLGVFIGVLILTLLCCLIPIKKVKQIEIIEALKSQEVFYCIKYVMWYNRKAKSMNRSTSKSPIFRESVVGEN